MPGEGKEPRVNQGSPEGDQVHDGGAGSARVVPDRSASADRKRVGIALIGGLATALAFAVMATDVRWEAGALVGTAAIGLAVAAWTLLLPGVHSVDPAGDRVLQLRGVATALAQVAAAGLATFLALRLAVGGSLPWPRLTAGCLVTGTFLLFVERSWHFCVALAFFDPKERSLFRRHGFWLVVLTTLLYLPVLGSFSLSDPWETHYGEVAREILARGDWISLWWAQDGWFWSKPILDFWVQSLSFALLGVEYLPDQMIASLGSGAYPMPEWAARFPIFLMTLVGDYLLYKGVSKAYGRTVGLVSGVILATSPYWFLLAHQTMTDMPYVAPLAGALGLLLWAICTPEQDADAAIRQVWIGSYRLRFSAAQLLLGLVLLMALPQILYLISRNVTVILAGAGGFGIQLHDDLFFAGSGPTGGLGNCGIPGNQGCSLARPHYASRLLQPAVLALVWSMVVGALVAVGSGERRLRRLAFMGAWICVALSAMAKGAPGLVIPWAALLAYLVATKRWRDLLDLQVGPALLILVALAFPWYVQAAVRHGPPFVDRLFFHDMYKRAFVHVHDTNTGVDVSFRYYVWQLGYGLFPWSGAALAGFLWWFRQRQDSAVGRPAALVALWVVSSFGMFTVSLTKFHHYALPVVPAVAVLAGYWVVKALDPGALPSQGRLALRLGGTLSGIALLVAACSRLQLSGDAASAPSGVGVSAALGLMGVGACWLSGMLVRRGHEEDNGDPSPSSESRGVQDPGQEGLNHDSMMVGLLGLAGALLLVLVGRDLVATVSGDVEGQSRLLQLFTYNYTRPWPKSLDFRPALGGFVAVAALSSALILVRRWRNQAVLMLGATSLVWAGWVLDVYLVLCSPHWGQRETVGEYYRRRKSPEEPLVAYQMNWKGENFYTGNRLPAFVSDSAGFRAYLAEQRRRHRYVLFVTTEHSRVASLRSELGQHKRLELLTTKELNNKFLLARVELQ